MMMDSIREGVKKPWAKILIFVIVISFVGAGYFTSALFLGDPNAAVVVNGESISRQQLQEAYSRTKQQYGDSYKQFVKTDEQERNFRENVLQSLISQEVIVQATRNLGMRISTDEIRRTIHEMPVLQEEGVYSSKLLDQALRNVGKSRSQFKQNLIVDLILRQLNFGITASEFVLPEELKNEFRILGQTRTGRALVLKYSSFANDIQISDEEVEQYYQENNELYRIEEKVSVDYIELSAKELEKTIAPTDEQITEYYESNLDRFQTEEKKRVSHILINTSDDESAALLKAQSIKAKLDAGGDFISFVKSESADEFSAENDGDLGVLEKGVMEQPFDDALQQLTNVGDISAPVKTSFGIHIIKLTELVATETSTIDEVRTQIISSIKKEMAEEAFYSKSQTLEEKSFEISDSLDEVAKLIAVKVETSNNFSRASATGLFSNDEVKEAAFSEKVLDEQSNSSVINITDNHIVVLRKNTYQPSKIQPLELVKAQVMLQLKSSKAKLAAVEYGNQLQQKFQDKENVDGLITSKGLSWKDLDKVKRKSSVLPYLQLQYFFKMKKPSSEEVTVELMEDYNELVIFVLNKVFDGDIDSMEKTQMTQLQQGLNRFYGEADYGSLVEQQRSLADVSRNQGVIDR